MADPVPAVHDWPTNGHLIADVARLHMSTSDVVLDTTYGRGLWWTEWRPDVLVTNDLHTDAGFQIDFREIWLDFDPGSFDVVAFDPPYKLNGTPALGDFDDRYGIAVPTGWQDRLQLIADGLQSCLRLKPRLVLAKCQDQVCSGKVRWQTFELMKVAEQEGARLVDRFDMVGGSRPQPSGRRQIHARGRGSSLLVFGW